MEVLKDELLRGIADADQLLRMLVRLLVASLLGGLLGFERQYEGKAAGIRTHMLVAVGSALFTLVPLEAGTAVNGNLGRIIQGIAAGIGFLGAGTILKLSEAQQIRGLTTAAGIWMTAAVGVAVGAGRIGLALLSAALALFILYVVHRVEAWFKSRRTQREQDTDSHQGPDTASRETI